MGGSEEERQAVGALFSNEAVRRLVLSLNARSEGSDLEVVDAAYWMKGCSSLGKLRYGVPIELKGGGRRNDYAMVDLKEGVESAAPSAHGSDMPAHNGARVVAGARALSLNLGDRMMPADLLGRPIMLRELMPQDLKLEFDQFSRAEAIQAARYLAYVVGRAHARQLDEADRSAWRNTLKNQHSDNLDAPNWLWSSVVDARGAPRGRLP